MKFESLEDLRNKIEWEGGLDMAMDYGITAQDVPEDAPEAFKALFAEMESAWDEYANLGRLVEEMLENLVDR